MVDDFVDIEVFISRAEFSQRFLRGESATAATTNVILAKKGTLRPGELLKQFAHSDFGIDGGGTHLPKIVAAVSDRRKLRHAIRATVRDRRYNYNLLGSSSSSMTRLSKR